MKFRAALIISALFFLTGNNSLSQERYELKSIEFKGNNSVSSSTLEGVIYSEETPWWFWKFLNSFTSLGSEAVYFDAEFISVDLESLAEYYNALGYFNTSFGYEYSADTAEKEVHLTYIISEGERSRYKDFYFYGINDLPQLIKDNFTAELYEDTTEFYDQNIVQSNIGEGLNYLKNNGYMLARFDSTIIYKDTIGYKACLLYTSRCV